MTLLQAMVLGMVQGLGEFLPISSSAHLVIVPWLFGWDDPGLGFDVMLHWGTLAAVLVYFRRDVLLLARGLWRSLFRSTRDWRNDPHQRMVWLLAIASVPGAVIGKLFETQVETTFRAPTLIAAVLVGFGLILMVADRYGRRQKQLGAIRWWDALLIGCSQALAVIPGVSRSGSTIAAALGLGFRREDAARFSFLMSIPIIFGAGLVKIGHVLDGADYAALAAGFIVSAVFGFLSIKYLLRYIAGHDFRLFVWYRFAFAALIATVILMRMQ
ncbi:MAG: undecaprenyl-diphosphatase UppP [Lentisphaerae bacterium]|nr:undecaprenyl-diphosphatase UppP [Lentisphaerota bacterium]